MDWIERWLGVSPDGGDGSLEWLVVLIGVTVVFGLILRLSPRARATFSQVMSALVPSALRRS